MAASRIGQRHGFACPRQDQVPALPADLFAHIEAIAEVAGQPDKIAATALLGTVSAPRIAVSRELGLYFKIPRGRRPGKSDAPLGKQTATLLTSSATGPLMSRLATIGVAGCQTGIRHQARHR
ncbi:hypothetical protein [Gemmobacter nectariphilus]|uniref:hypothetical protein n=1 Tax=Gemmobacter nectariphilus TaxID=220343 RepID=UPI0012B6445D